MQSWRLKTERLSNTCFLHFCQSWLTLCCHPHPSLSTNPAKREMHLCLIHLLLCTFPGRRFNGCIYQGHAVTTGPCGGCDPSTSLLRNYTSHTYRILKGFQNIFTYAFSSKPHGNYYLSGKGTWRLRKTEFFLLRALWLQGAERGSQWHDSAMESTALPHLYGRGIDLKPVCELPNTASCWDIWVRSQLSASELSSSLNSRSDVCDQLRT